MWLGNAAVVGTRDGFLYVFLHDELIQCVAAHSKVRRSITSIAFHKSSPYYLTLTISLQHFNFNTPTTTLQHFYIRFSSRITASLLF